MSTVEYSDENTICIQMVVTFLEAVSVDRLKEGKSILSKFLPANRKSVF